MADDLVIVSGEKSAIYNSLNSQIKALVGDESNQTANLANVAAAIKQTFNHLWVGFYMVKENELVLGPFQGPIACTRIAKGKGVCGTAWMNENTMIVKNVALFPGHIACSSESKSEIVVPLIKDGVVIGILDIDSDELATFDDVDEQYLNQLCEWLVTII